MKRFLPVLVDRHRHSALGVLVKGIIHNLNGSLQILSMHMELLQRVAVRESSEVSSLVDEKLKKCFEQIEKMKGMLNLLQERAAHSDQDDYRSIYLNDLLGEELELLHHQLFFKHEVKVRKEFSNDLPLLSGYYIDFREGLLNLIQNSIEAMEGSPRKELTVLTKEGDRRVEVIIEDTGCGIPEEIGPNIFQPFFTTKGESHFGLGLFISQALLSPYGATFNFTSREGETVFSVNFPLPDG